MDKKYSNLKTKNPTFLQGILWSRDIKRFNLEEDKIYIIHQILSYGNLKQIKWLFRVYKPKEIQEVFLKHPKRIYTAPVFHFVKNFILGLKGKKLSAQKYVKITYRAFK